MTNIYTIYKATNLINGKCYIGFDSKWPSRQIAHKHLSVSPKYAFHKAIKKYKWDNFKWEIIYQTLDKKHAFECEMYFIKYYNSMKNGYNMAPGGTAPMIGKKHSKKSMLSMSKNTSGTKKSKLGRCFIYKRS